MMAGVDYGAIVKVDGKIVNWGMELYPRMANLVGFTLETADASYTYNGEFRENYRDIDGKFNYYVGDESFLVGVFKDIAIVVENGVIDENIGFIKLDVEEDDALVLFDNNVNIEMERIDEGPRVFTRFTYNGHDYDILHGYLVDNEDTEWVRKYIEDANRELIRDWLRDGGIDA